MHDFLDIINRSFLSLGILFIMTKFLGRRQISQLSFFDYIIGISMGSIASEMATNTDTSILHGLISMSIYTFVCLLTNYATIKSLFFRRVISGKPLMLIDNGKIIKKNFRKGRIEINDLLTEARYSGFFSLNEIAFAIMENCGKISFLPYKSYQNIKAIDLDLPFSKTLLPVSIIVDGTLLKDSLEKTGKTEKWVLDYLEKNNTSLKNVLLAILDGEEIRLFTDQ